jgi:hypothetical protein
MDSDEPITGADEWHRAELTADLMVRVCQESSTSGLMSYFIEQYFVGEAQELITALINYASVYGKSMAWIEETLRPSVKPAALVQLVDQLKADQHLRAARILEHIALEPLQLAGETMLTAYKIVRGALEIADQGSA